MTLARPSVTLASDNPQSEAFFMPGSVSCPQCGHVLFAIELPGGSAVPARARIIANSTNLDADPVCDAER